MICKVTKPGTISETDLVQVDTLEDIEELIQTVFDGVAVVSVDDGFSMRQVEQGE